MSNRASSFPADRAAPPWYRHRWPWLLIAGPALAIVASLASAWLAVVSDDGVVAADYYKQGLLINRKLGSGSPAAMPEPSAIVSVGNDGRVEVRLTYEGRAPTRVRLVLRYPGDQAQVLALTPSADRVWVGTVAAQTPGRWIVTLESDLWRLPVTTVEGRLGEIRLGAVHS
jgi:hypothetical protein